MGKVARTTCGLWALLATLLLCGHANAQSAQILPNAKTQFLDAQGAPLVGGLVYTCVPNTNNTCIPGSFSPKTTWRDAFQTTPNSNPVILDSSGSAFIYGSGAYAETVYDQFNNLIWSGYTWVIASGTAGATSNDIPIFCNNGALCDSGVMMAPATALVLYVSPSGSDSASNNCTSVSSPCTARRACQSRSGIATYLSGPMSISGADGTYTALDGFGNICSVEGNSGGSSGALTSFIGNCVTPSNVVLSIPTGSTGFFVKDSGEAELSCVKVQAASGGTVVGASAAQAAVLDVINTVWGNFGASSVGIQVSQNASVNLLGTAALTIGGGLNTFLSIGSGGLLSANGATTIAIPSPVAWGGQFIQIFGSGSASLAGMTFTGSGVASTTGKRASLIGPVYLSTGGVACGTFFPGNSPCTLVNGAQDDANDATALLGQLITSFGTPSIASGACGATTNGTLAAGSTNQAGTVQIGSATTTSCTISFSATLASAPLSCVIFPTNATAAATGTTVARVSSISTSAWVITGSALASANYNYLCI